MPSLPRAGLIGIFPVFGTIPRLRRTANLFLAFMWQEEQLPRSCFIQDHAAGRWAAGDNIMGPSPLRDPAMAEIPREMTREDIRAVIEAFAAAARRVQACGFDAVEIHGTHGYLINQFLSGFSNKRCDEYGGSVTNRARFAVEIVRAVRDAVGPDYPFVPVQRMRSRVWWYRGCRGAHLRPHARGGGRRSTELFTRNA